MYRTMGLIICPSQKTRENPDSTGVAGTGGWRKVAPALRISTRSDNFWRGSHNIGRSDPGQQTRQVGRIIPRQMPASKRFWPRFARPAALVALAGLLGLPSGCRRGDEPEGGGRRLVATVRSEPKSFNRIASSSPAENIVAYLTQSTLVRVHRVTGELEPRLAREWTLGPDGRTWTIKLREGVTYSDGAPFTAADVVFTFQALYDPRVESMLTSSLLIDGKPIAAIRVDDLTVQLTFPSTYGPGLSALDSLPILPSHKLKPLLDAGTFAAAWNLKTPPAEIVGTGPFVMAEYVPGVKVRMTRNARFWLSPLPQLDEIELQIVPSQNAEVLRLESGQSDLQYDYARAEDLATLRQAAARGTLQLVEAGVDIAPNALWFNLAPSAAGAKTRPWLQRDEFRKAVSYAVNRQAIVDTVYLGAAVPVYGPITPGNKEWYAADLPSTPHDPAKAKALLAGLGLADRNGDGMLEDPRNQPVRFSIAYVKGDSIRERTASMVQSQLRQVGVAVDLAPEDLGGHIRRFGEHDFDTIYYAVKSDTFDPARNPDFWMSAGSFHLWNSHQATPATPWEARIDELMRRQSTTVDRAERKRLFKEVQQVFHQYLPALYFAANKPTVAMSARVRGAVPTVLTPPVLWNAEALSVIERR